MDTEPSGLPNGLLLALALEQRAAVLDFVETIPRIEVDHRALLGASRVLLAQIPIGAAHEPPNELLSSTHRERLEQVIALCALVLRM